MISSKALNTRTLALDAMVKSNEPLAHGQLQREWYGTTRSGAYPKDARSTHLTPPCATLMNVRSIVGPLSLGLSTKESSATFSSLGKRCGRLRRLRQGQPELW